MMNEYSLKIMSSYSIQETMQNPIQQQLIAARKSQILDAAAKVFGEKGYHQTTTKDIARQAEIAEGTIYNYFDNKMALLFGILERIKTIAMQDETVMMLKDADLHSFLQAYIRHPLMVLKQDNFELFRVIIGEMMVNQELRARYREQILEPTMMFAEMQLQQWLAQNVIKPIDIKLMVHTISSMMTGLIWGYITGDETLEAHWDTLPEFLTRMILEGIANK